MKQLNAKDVSEDDANTAQNEVKSLTPEIAHRISDVVYICYLWVSLGRLLLVLYMYI